ncbi:MAG: pilus assembly protein [Anaerolineae bacterium]
MRRILRKILQILDGTPAVYGQYSRGQSVVELALVTPILIILLMGMVEIGWFANNYLIILETTRVGARQGTTLTEDKTPLKWETFSDSRAASLIPALQPDAAAAAEANTWRHCPTMESNPATYERFYNKIACQMLKTLAPLEFQADNPGTAVVEPGNGVDDIIISAFSLQTVDPTDTDIIPSGARSNIALVPGYPTNQQQVILAGRYPTNANECSYDAADSRDPFNYIDFVGSGTVGGRVYGTDGTRNYVLLDSSKPDLPPPNDSNRLYYELAGYDNTTERQRGFSYTGQHIIESTKSNSPTTTCYGSEWTMNEVEQLMNLSSFNLSDGLQRVGLPSQGLVLVEMFWRHGLLLRNPVFNPVFSLLSDDKTATLGPGTTISVWAAFPLPSTEARIIYAPVS